MIVLISNIFNPSPSIQCPQCSTKMTEQEKQEGSKDGWPAKSNKTVNCNREEVVGKI